MPSDILLYNGNDLTDNKGARESVTKESIQKVFIALRWNVIRNEEVHVYCIQKSSSRVFVQLCTTSRL